MSATTPWQILQSLQIVLFSRPVQSAKLVLYRIPRTKCDANIIFFAWDKVLARWVC
jgi:hypothetical protein